MDSLTLACLIVFILLVIVGVLSVFSSILKVILNLLSNFFPGNFKHRDLPGEPNDPDIIYHGVDPEIYRKMNYKVRESLDDSVREYKNTPAQNTDNEIDINDKNSK